MDQNCISITDRVRKVRRFPSFALHVTSSDFDVIVLMSFWWWIYFMPRNWLNHFPTYRSTNIRCTSRVAQLWGITVTSIRSYIMDGRVPAALHPSNPHFVDVLIRQPKSVPLNSTQQMDGLCMYLAGWWKDFLSFAWTEHRPPILSIGKYFYALLMMRLCNETGHGCQSRRNVSF